MKIGLEIMGGDYAPHSTIYNVNTIPGIISFYINF
jgi:fatty acid/phospholipid biosynthesis enzyme